MGGKSNKQKVQLDFNPEAPLEGQGISKDMRTTITQVLCALYKSNVAFLPTRIDQKCRKRLEHEIKSLNDHGIGRALKFSNCKMDNSSGKEGWKKSNEGGREWREGIIKGTIIDCLVSNSSGEIISERKIRDGFVTIVQSRRISSKDRKEDKNTYYKDKEKIICSSCGVEIDLDSEIVTCPYCGAYIESGFYDWQLESFEIGKQNAKHYMYFGALLALVILSTIFSSLLAKNWYKGIFPGLCAGIVIWLVLITLLLLKKDLSKQIVRYSENTLRKNLTEYLWDESNDKDILERNLDEFVIKKVVNSETETHIVVKASIKEQKYDSAGDIEFKVISRMLVLKRARFPDRLKEKGTILQEKECPSCGGNYIPDYNGNCSYCGYGLYVQNRNWKIEERL